MKLAKHDLGGKLNYRENYGDKNKRRGRSEKELEEYTEKKVFGQYRDGNGRKVAWSLTSTVAPLGFVRQMRGPNVNQLRSIHTCQIR